MKHTPCMIEVLLHFYATPEPHPKRQAPSVNSCIGYLVSHCMIGGVGNEEYKLTARGRAWVDMVLKTPFPEKVYVDPRTKEAVGDDNE